jgi:hypothetical protein
LSSRPRRNFCRPVRFADFYIAVHVHQRVGTAVTLQAPEHTWRGRFLACRSEVVRAYPLRFMRWHEVVNDQLPDGSNVTIVYDTRTASALAMDNSVLRCDNCTFQGFGNSGFFYESHLLIYDFNSSSLWLPVKVRSPRLGPPMHSLTPRPLRHPPFHAYPAHNLTPLYTHIKSV